MNHREPPLLPVDSYRALYFITLLFLPALAPTQTHATGRVGVADSTPYLLAVGAPPLRFRAALPPPNYGKQPTAGAPPVPNSEGSITAAPVSNRPDVLLAPPPASTGAVGETSASAKATANPSTPPPAAIIPDDTRPNVRPEDFLPFFQLPGPANAPAHVEVIAPVPPAAPTATALPVSSASYKQTP